MRPKHTRKSAFMFSVRGHVRLSSCVHRMMRRRTFFRGVCFGCRLSFGGLVALAFSSAMADGQQRCLGVSPLRIPNLDPFHHVYGAPTPHGACVLESGSSEVTFSSDVASHMTFAQSGAERLLVDGETYRQSVALRYGLSDGWEGILEVSMVSHTRGVFDGFIENWHDFFGLPQGGRDVTPHDRLAFTHSRNGMVRVDVDQGITAPGDVMLGLGRRLERNHFRNDGLALRGAISLPTGDENALVGSGGMSASLWAETSGDLFPREGSRTWLYGASLGVQAGSSPSSLSGMGGRVIAFGHFGVTWQPLDRLSLTAQIDANSTPYTDSSLAPLSGPVVMFGAGGAYRISRNTTLEIAVSEDDGWRHAAHDFGVHISLRRKM